MRPKKLLGMVGILGLTLAFGLVLSGCEIEPETFTLQIRNDFTENISIRIDELQGTTERPSVRTAISNPGVSRSFSLPQGEYRVAIDVPALGTVRYPPGGGFVRMSGTVNLVFDGVINRQ